MAASKNVDVRIDRSALKKALKELPTAERADWCVACGAGASAVKLDTPIDLVQTVGRDVVENPETLQSILSQVEGDGLRNWCVACGAGAAPTPDYDYLSKDIPDSVLDSLSDRLISAVKVR